MEYRLPIPEWIVFLLIHVGIPAIGILGYVRLVRWLHLHGEQPTALLLLFALFFCWGGLLLIALTALFWYWSGMASLGALFTLFVSPFVVAPATVILGRVSRVPNVRRASSYAAVAYYLCLGLGVTVLICLGGRR